MVAAIALIGFLIFSVQSARSLNFQAFEPTRLPDGISLNGHDTTTVSTASRTYKQVSLRTNTPNFFIGEQKSTFDEYLNTTHSCESNIINSTCTDLTSSLGQDYAVSTSFTNTSDEAFSQTISWHKGETRFWIELKDDQVQKYSDDLWGNIIDSFRPVDYGQKPSSKVLEAFGS